MKATSLKAIFSAIRLYIPFKVNLVVALSMMWATQFLLTHNQTATSSYAVILKLIASVIFNIILLAIILSLISVLINWVHFLWAKKKNPKHQLQLQLQAPQHVSSRLPFNLQIQDAIKPILGAVKIRLKIDNTFFSDVITLTQRLHQNWLPWKKGVVSELQLYLPDYREYHISSAIVYFEDLFQFFRLPTHVLFETSFLHHPSANNTNETAFSVTTSEDEIIKIDELKKVDGEFLNYKKFEPQDDVRRIVWKIFAKNKELVVRKPEQLDPYASHIYTYFSFYKTPTLTSNAHFERTFLNYYKSYLWSLIEQMKKTIFELRYMSDQFEKTTHADHLSIQDQITRSEWQQNITLDEFLEHKKPGVICLHSLSSIKDIEKICYEIHPNSTVFFIRLSAVMKIKFTNHPFLTLFRKPKADSLSLLRQQWLFSPYRFIFLQHEKKVETLLRKQQIPVQFLP
jgi:hypothetical protein